MVWYVDKHVCLPLLANAYMPMKILVHPGFNNPLKSLGKSAGRLFCCCWGHMTQDRGVFYTGVGGSSLVGQSSHHCFKVLFCQTICLLWHKLLLSWKEWPLTLRCWWTLLSRGVGSPVLGRTLVLVWSLCWTGLCNLDWTGQNTYFTLACVIWLSDKSQQSSWLSTRPQSFYNSLSVTSLVCPFSCLTPFVFPGVADQTVSNPRWCYCGTDCSW